MLVTFLAVVAATAYLYVAVPKGFIPDTDNDQFNVNMECRAGHFVLPDDQVRAARGEYRDPGPGCRQLHFMRTGGGGGGYGGANNGNLDVDNSSRGGSARPR